MRIAVDTSVIVRYTNRTDAHFHEVHERIRELHAAGHELSIAPQSVYEYWAVATRPSSANGLGQTIDDTERALLLILRAFVLIPDPPDLLDRWLYLCRRHQVMGRNAHDARIVAWMLGNRVDQLFTRDRGDFARFDEITLV